MTKKTDTAIQKSKELTETEEFNPTPGMEKWLATAVELHSDSPTEIAAASKMTKQAWYKWLEKPGFEDWYYEAYRKARRRWLPTLDKIGMKNAVRDYNYWKDMRKAAGDVEEKTTNNIQVNVLNHLKSEKDAFGI